MEADVCSKIAFFTELLKTKISFFFFYSQWFWLDNLQLLSYSFAHINKYQSKCKYHFYWKTNKQKEKMETSALNGILHELYKE